MKTIFELPEGYNGHKVKCFAKSTDGFIVECGVVGDPSYMTKWTYIDRLPVGVAKECDEFEGFARYVMGLEKQ